MFYEEITICCWTWLSGKYSNEHSIPCLSVALPICRMRGNGCHKRRMQWQKDQIPSRNTIYFRQRESELQTDKGICLLVGIPWYTKKLLRTHEYDGIFMTARIPLLLRIMKSADKDGVSLFYDAVEWYSSSQFKKGERAHQYRKIK